MMKQKKIFIRITIFSILFVTPAILILGLGLELMDYNSPIINPKAVYAEEPPPFYQLDLDSIDELEDDLSILAEDLSVTIASRMNEDISSAPSIVTVITAEEIENIGARTLTDILRIVPGFDIIKRADFGTQIIGVRGVRDASQKVELLLNGHSLNEARDGAPEFFFDDLPLKNVKKIEIIRGPGSALYGTSAFLAVINVITKEASDIDGIEVSSGFGTYDTQEFNILFGKTMYGVDIAGFATYYNSNGISEKIKEDALTGTDFTRTPGDTDDGRERLDLNLELSYKDFTFNAKYTNKDMEPFTGGAFVLTDDGESFFNFVMAELSYKKEIFEKLTIQPRIYYDQYDQDFFVESLPDGFTTSDKDGDGEQEIFADGKIIEGIGTSRRLGGEIQADYELTDNNTFTIGFEYIWERMDNVQTYRNSDPDNGSISWLNRERYRHSSMDS